MAIRQAWCYFLLANLSFGLTPANWNFEEAYSGASNVFVGKVLKVETGLEYESNSSGPDQKANAGTTVVWTDARRFTVSVMESLKGEPAPTVELINVGGPQAFAGDAGGNRSRQPVPDYGIPRPMLNKDRMYLFFVSLDTQGKTGRIGLRSAFPLEEAKDELQVLRLLRYDPSISTFSEAALAIDEWEENSKEQQMTTISRLEDDFRNILNANPDLQGRKQNLKTFIQRLGFDGLRPSYTRRPEGASEIDIARDRLWENASQEIVKIDMILKAREAKEAGSREKD
jgi:hypothetical protein